MSTSTIATSLEKAVNKSSKTLGQFQVGMNKILWGSGNVQPTQTVQFMPTTGSTGQTISGSFIYSSTIPTKPIPASKGNILDTGIINALNALNQVDLCNIISYNNNPVSVTAIPRPPQPWSEDEVQLYYLQDSVNLIQQSIDYYFSNPVTLISTFADFVPQSKAPFKSTGSVSTGSISSSAQPLQNTTSQNQAILQNTPAGSGLTPPINDTTTTPSSTQAQQQNTPPGSNGGISGISVRSYNLYTLILQIDTILTTNYEGITFTGSLYEENSNLVPLVLALGPSLNILDNFRKDFEQYSDWTTIKKVDANRLQLSLPVLRSICVAIQSTNFTSRVATTAALNYLNNDIRTQIQQLNKFLDPTQIIPSLKNINDQIKAFILTGNQVQKVLRTAQTQVKLILYFYKVFKFVISFLTKLPLPNQFTTAGMSNAFSQATQGAKNETDGTMRLLTAINALLSVTVNFIRYILTNANEVLTRLETLLASLQGCDAVKNSEVVSQLQQTRNDLQNLVTQLKSYLANYDLKTSQNTTTFGSYTISIEEEQTSSNIQHKRRRGIALNQYGEIVASSDLTFATNTAIIIQEVQEKLVSLGLAKSNNINLDATNQAIIAESIGYLNNNDVAQSDFTIPTTSLDTPDNLDENSGLGLNAFMNNSKGGRRLRTRTRTALDSASKNLQSQLATENNSAKQSISGSIT